MIQPIVLSRSTLNFFCLSSGALPAGVRLTVTREEGVIQDVPQTLNGCKPNCFLQPQKLLPIRSQAFYYRYKPSRARLRSSGWPLLLLSPASVASAIAVSK